MSKEVFKKLKDLISVHFSTEEQTKLNELPTPIPAPLATSPAPTAKEFKTAEGLSLFIVGDSPLVDATVFADAQCTTPIADGNYNIEGSTLVIAGGKITEVVSKENAPAESAEMAAVVTQMKAEKVAFDSQLAELKTDVIFLKKVIATILETPVANSVASNNAQLETTFNAKLSIENYNKLNNKEKEKHNSIFGRP